MPILRKTTPTEAAQWEAQTRDELETALAAFAKLPDRRGLTRMRYERSDAGWFARVYRRGQTVSRLFSDAVYGGPVSALMAAVAWRDTTRVHLGPPLQRQRRTEGRVVRVDRWGQLGYYAYPLGNLKRKYFADGAHGGQEGSLAAATEWANQVV